MNACIRKECRALAPTWVVALLLVVAPLFLPWFVRGLEVTLPLLAPGFVLGVVLLSVAAFGKEFAQGTYGLLLVQPVSRWRLWWEKTLVLAAALIMMWLLLAVVALVGAQPHHSPGDLTTGEYLAIGLLIAAAAYGGGIGLTLLLRQANGAFWLTLLLPAAVCISVEWLAGNLLGERNTDWLLVGALAVYTVVSYLVALRLFLKREDLPWLAGDVSIPLPAWVAGRSTPPRPGRRFGALASLVSKELHFQQINLFCGLLLVLLFASIVATRHSESTLGDIPIQQLLIGLGILVYALIPFLIGAVAIAEERRLGILEWQQSLPISRRRQFLAKLIPAYALSLLLGAALPWVLDALAYAAAGESVTGSMKMFREASDPNGTARAFWMIVGLPGLFCLVATTVGVFASSLVRNLLQALSVTIGLVIATWALVGLFLLNYENAWVAPLGLLALVGVPTLLVVLGWLSYRNYCEAVPGARLSRRNLTVLVITYAGILATTTALYARAWEVFIPGPRISDAHLKGTVTPKILAQHPVHFILLPNGTLWEWKRDRTYSSPPQPCGKTGEWRDVASRWIQRKPQILEALALKSDGTLWHWQYVFSTNAGYHRQTDPALFGTGHDWLTIAGGGSHVVALKTDHSLWAWGKNDQGQLGDGTTIDRDEPLRIGSDANWVNVAVGWGTTLAVKTDGTLWEWGSVPSVGRSPWSVGPAPCPLPRRVDRGTNWAFAAASGNGGQRFAIQTDGSLWRWGHYDGSWEPGLGGERMPVFRGPTRVSKDRDWAKFCWDLSFGVGLKSDGTLLSSSGWEDVFRSPCADLEQKSFRRLKDQRPWLAVGILWSDFGVALAADGNLWTWGVPPRYTDEEEPRWRLIPPSVQPRLVARLAEAGNAE